MLKVSDFLSQLRKANNARTLYVMGGWGYPLGYSGNRDRTQSNSYNRQSDRKAKIYAASNDTFAFDCCGLIKAMLWGWDGDFDKRNGGAEYAKGCPDWDAKELMFKGCNNPTTDFTRIQPGWMLWLDGHCGVYLGDGLAIESTPKWQDGVQITAVENIGKKPGYNSRKWTYCGALKYVDYSEQPPAPTPSGYKPGNVYKVICTGPLRIRKGATTSADIIDNLYRGDKILCEDVVKDSSGNIWLKITGYTCANYGGEVYISAD